MLPVGLPLTTAVTSWWCRCRADRHFYVSMVSVGVGACLLLVVSVRRCLVLLHLRWCLDFFVFAMTIEWAMTLYGVRVALRRSRFAKKRSRRRWKRRQSPWALRGQTRGASDWTMWLSRRSSFRCGSRSPTCVERRNANTSRDCFSVSLPYAKHTLICTYPMSTTCSTYEDA